MSSKATAVLASLVAMALIAPSPAYGYLDPGTGSLIVQVAIAAVVGIGAALKLYWGKVKTVLSRGGEPGPEE